MTIASVYNIIYWQYTIFSTGSIQYYLLAVYNIIYWQYTILSAYYLIYSYSIWTDSSLVAIVTYFENIMTFASSDESGYRTADATAVAIVSRKRHFVVESDEYVYDESVCS